MLRATDCMSLPVEGSCTWTPMSSSKVMPTAQMAVEETQRSFKGIRSTGILSVKTPTEESPIQMVHPNANKQSSIQIRDCTQA